MSFRVRLSVAVVCAGLLGGVGVLLMQSGASARAGISYAHLNKIQRRIVSETLASALGPRPKGLRPRIEPGGGDPDAGSGPDGAPFTPPASFGSANGTGSPSNYFPTQQGQCSQTKGSGVKVNQNCLNLTDPDLQGRGQANNETVDRGRPEQPAPPRRQ